MASGETGRRFDGQVVVITGAAQGIGLATAELFAEEGAAVAMIDVDGDLLKKAAAAISSAGGNAHPYPADVTNEDEIGRVFEDALGQHGSLEILVNLAAIYPFMPIEETSLEDWRKVTAANIDGTFLCCRAALPHMRQRGYGRIVNTSSGTVLNGLGGLTAYVTTKAGVIGFTRALAREAGGDGVTANVVMPGLIATENVLTMRNDEAATNAFFEETIAQQCIKRRGEPKDIAHGIAYLASREASFVTGQTLYVGGGYGFV